MMCVLQSQDFFTNFLKILRIYPEKLQIAVFIARAYRYLCAVNVEVKQWHSLAAVKLLPAYLLAS